MEITIKLPLPDGEDVEENLSKEFGHLVSVCKSVLSDYKKRGFATPTLAIKLPAKFKKEAEVPEHKIFVETLLKHHLDRVPTANVPAQRQCLRRLYEAGYTSVEDMKGRYDTKLKNYRDTSWFTIEWAIKNEALGKTATAKPATDMEFHRVELTEDATENLIARLKATALDTDGEK